MNAAVKVVFSNEDPLIQSEVVPALKGALECELGCEVSVIQKYSALETLTYVTDNVVDLVIIRGQYRSADMNRQALVAGIKKLDKTIPIIVFSKEPPPQESDYASVDGWYSYPLEARDVKLVSMLLRNQPLVAEVG
ncbi:MAG: hypothetical protein HY537_13630 [Deltaproteobacteria bacterium]|nr:hypothetical protein [Deltaproteobacteria bacterium]